MGGAEPTTELHAGFSSENAVATPWPDAVRRLEDASIFWISTVRPDGRPHVTPLIAVWLDGAAYFSTGPTERKAKNLDANASCILTTGSNGIDGGLDLVIEGEAVRVRDQHTLHRIADAFESKYGSQWRFEVGDDSLHSEESGAVLVFKVEPAKVLGFGKGDTFTQTRWRFDDASPAQQCAPVADV